MRKSCTWFCVAVALSSLWVGAVSPPLQAEEPAGDPPPQAQRAELYEEFARTMSGATMIGSFTTTGSADGKLTEERYTLGEVKKLPDGDFWLFETRIQYGTHDLTVPLTLEVKWAGDTPVITLDKLEIPGLGTFTARVVIFQGEYAGMWNAGDHGGQLFGRIESAAEETNEEPAE